MTADEVRAIKAKWETLPGGPWHLDGPYLCAVGGGWIGRVWDSSQERMVKLGTTIASARSDVPALCDAYLELSAKLSATQNMLGLMSANQSVANVELAAMQKTIDALTEELADVSEFYQEGNDATSR